MTNEAEGPASGALHEQTVTRMAERLSEFLKTKIVVEGRIDQA
jgi:hypothetical protein